MKVEGEVIELYTGTKIASDGLEEFIKAKMEKAWGAACHLCNYGDMGGKHPGFESFEEFYEKEGYE